MPFDFAISALLTLFVVADPVGLLAALPGAPVTGSGASTSARGPYDGGEKQRGRCFMVQLADGDIKTREVLGWKGVHVLHFMGSSCSQKLRIFLNLKGIPWQSHPIDLPAYENMQPWFLGINPRGLVPVLVHDGAVHIESNDIIQ